MTPEQARQALPAAIDAILLTTETMLGWIDDLTAPDDRPTTRAGRQPG